MDVLDRDLLLRNVGGDRDFLKEIVGLFFETTGEIVGAIHAAVGTFDHESLHRSAHQLKGALASVGALAATAAAGDLEELARDGRRSGLAEALSSLDLEMRRLTPHLESLAAERD